MQVHQTVNLWLDKSQEVSVVELMEVSGFSEKEVLEFVDLGAIEPTNLLAEPLSFYADCVVTIRRMSRLRDELELDAHALTIVLGLLQKIQNLEISISLLRAQKPAL
jgi:MerR HTH family regulatory protein